MVSAEVVFIVSLFNQIFNALWCMFIVNDIENGTCYFRETLIHK